MGMVGLRVAVFLDGGYLSYVLRDEFDSLRIDYERLVAAMVGEDRLVRAYYYNCLPYHGPCPSDEERQRLEAAQRFHGVLRRLRRFDVREGVLAFRGVDQATGRAIFEQKKVDVMLATDLVSLAIKGRIDRAVLCTGDSDVLPAVEAAKAEGVVVHLWHGRQVHQDLWERVDERTLLTADMVRRWRLGGEAEAVGKDNG